MVSLGGGFHRQVGCNDGEDTGGILDRNRAGDHPYLAAAGIKVGIGPDSRVVRNVVRAVVANAAVNFSAVRLGQLWSLILFVSALLPQLHFQIRAFRARFLVLQRRISRYCG